MQQRGGSQSETKIKAICRAPGISAVVMSQLCPQWGRGVSPGFLQGWRTGSVACRGLWSSQTGVLVSSSLFFYKALILLSGSELHILQCYVSPEEVGGEILGNRREEEEEEGATVFSCVLYWFFLVVRNQRVWRLYCTVLRNSRDRQMTVSFYWLLRFVIRVVKRCLL